MENVNDAESTKRCWSVQNAVGAEASEIVNAMRDDTPRPQRQYKDRLFRMIFREKKELLSLYNAVNGTDYEDPEELEINTLENAIYMNMKNDVSFVLQAELNLYEHQSTFNPNLPLRDLFYIARQLEKLTMQSSLYGNVPVRIPTPRFAVFYNGTQEQPERRVLRLSDVYEKPVESPELELTVLMLNINRGKNCEIMEKCRSLKEYMLYVAKVREYTAVEGIEAAVDRAVNECISEDILRDFLLRNRAEAIRMSIFEYDEERERELLKKAYLEEGEEIGETRGRKEGMKIGQVRGKAESILTLLADLGEIPAELQEYIYEQQDPKLLQEWLRLAARSENLEEFCRSIHYTKKG